MNWDAIGAIGEVIGALAVVLTLAYLAIQIRQNASSVRASAYQAWAAAMSAPVTTAQQADVAQAITGLGDPTTLTPVSAIQLAHWLYSIVHVGEATHYLHRDGVIGDEVYETQLKMSVASILSPTGKQWWDAGGRSQFTEEFVNVVESRRGDPTRYKLWAFTEGRGFHEMANDS